MSSYKSYKSSHKEALRVNDRLHALRGEQFRHQQNVQKSQTHISSTFIHNSPTLPVNLIGPDYSSPDLEPVKVEDTHSAFKKCSGPEPPKSWTLTSKQDVHDTPTWRAQALSVVLDRFHPTSQPSSQSPVPPLTLLCLLNLVSSSATEFSKDVVPSIPSHLRRDLIQYTAVHSPLPSSKLFAMYEPEGHTVGELIVVGPSASLRDDYFLNTSLSRTDDQPYGEEETWDWDSQESTPHLFRTLILLSTHLATSTLFTLPPTITHMALVNLPIPVSLHRLPGICPLLVILDLSHNTWLSHTSKGAPKLLERVDWSRWNSLRTLGFRKCHIPDGMLLKLNKGRWDDVEVVQ